MTGRGQGEDILLAGLGMTVQVHDQLALFASYDGQFNDRSDTHSGELGARFAF